MNIFLRRISVGLSTTFSNIYSDCCLTRYHNHYSGQMLLSVMRSCLMLRQYLGCAPPHEVGWDFDLMSRKEYANLNYPTKHAALPLHRAFRFPVYREETVTLYFFPWSLPSHLWTLVIYLSIGDILDLNMRPSIVPTYSLWLMGS